MITPSYRIVRMNWNEHNEIARAGVLKEINADVDKYKSKRWKELPNKLQQKIINYFAQ